MNWPKPLSGISAFAHWGNRLLEACRSRELLPGPGYRIKRSSRGINLEILTGGGGVSKSTPQSSGMNFRGEWADLAYAVGDVVVIRTGSNMGTFVCVKAVAAGSGNAPTVPDIGNQYWVNLPPNGTIGSWL